MCHVINSAITFNLETFIPLDLHFILNYLHSGTAISDKLNVNARVLSYYYIALINVHTNNTATFSVYLYECVCCKGLTNIVIVFSDDK